MFGFGWERASLIVVALSFMPFPRRLGQKERGSKAPRGGAGVGPGRDGRALPLPTGTGPSGAGEQPANDFGGARVELIDIDALRCGVAPKSQASVRTACFDLNAPCLAIFDTEPGLISVG